jgi:hypothetical protein
MGMLGGTGGSNPASERSRWITTNCSKVPASAYGGSTLDGTGGGTSADDSAVAALMGGSTLYDCAAK